MKKFMDENFLLSNDTAIKLYHEYAKHMSICDYHCHLDPKEIWENKKFNNITEAWLGGDHYKWRAMRSNGINEEYITGNASDYNKFISWAKTIENAFGNPLYHWTHLELKKYFSIDIPLSEETADYIWGKCNDVIQSEDFSARSIIKKFNVKLIGTTDDPTDTLEYHKKIKEDGTVYAKVIPTFRPDKGLEVNKEGFKVWIDKLSEVTEKNIKDYKGFLEALKERVNFFHEQSCCIADHSLEYVPYKEASIEEVEDIFNRALNGEKVSLNEEKKYKTYTLIYLGKLYSSLNWVMQFHIGAMRNNNTKMFEKIGLDAGFDSINDYDVARPLSRLLDSMEKENSLPKTILYTLNPRDNYVLGSMMGNFQGSIPGKVQFGAAWWFNDNKEGITRQMIDLSNLGLLNRFVGMLTDSRSFLSYTRHEYFRRILCNLIGEWVENGEVPNDDKILKNMIENICYNNAKEYFNINKY